MDRMDQTAPGVCRGRILCAISRRFLRFAPSKGGIFLARNMTQGDIPRHLAAYAVPLILGNLFQLTYNAIDSMIVGRFIGKEALAAVGTVSPVMNLIVLGVSGLCVGASVLMSGFYGGGQAELLKKELATTLLCGVWFSAIAVPAGVFAAQPLLRLLAVPEDIRGVAGLYLCIVLTGIPFTFFYNALSSALKSIGDSKTPLKFLALCSVLNGAADCVLIGVFRLGIVCSAATTVAAQALSALLCARYIRRHIPALRLERRHLRIHRALLKQTLRCGGATALQQSCQPIGKLMIQGVVNTLGVDAIAAFNAIGRIDDYACLPEQSIAQSITTFVAQNDGAGKPERIRRGFRAGLLLEACYGVCICCAIFLLRTPAMRLFVTGAQGAVVALGSDYFRVMAAFYLLPAFTNGVQGYFRGKKHMKTTLLGTLTQIGLRAALSAVWVPRIGLVGVAFASAAGWCAMLLYEVPYYFYLKRREDAAQHEAAQKS